MLRFSVVVLSLSLMGQQCIRLGRGGGGGVDGGVFKSVNSGQEWVQKAAIPTVQGVKSMAGTNVVSLTIDPQDHLAIYAGTRENGLFYSYDGGESWAQAKGVASGRVAAIAVDPANKCAIYVLTANRLLKSTDCNRTFQESYRDATPESFVSAIAIIAFNPNVVYLGTSKGTLLRSVDAGRSWGTVKAFQSRITDILVDPRNSSVIYVATANRGVHRSDNNGASFTDLSEGMKQYQGGVDVRHLVLDVATQGALIAATRYGLLRSTDSGTSWTPMTLVTQPGKVEILSLAINPKNSREIYYGTATTFYRSSDGGVNWSTKKLPSSRTATALLVDFKDPKTIYLGVTEIKK